MSKVPTPPGINWKRVAGAGLGSTAEPAEGSSHAKLGIVPHFLVTR
jgi:hypothetical protein